MRTQSGRWRHAERQAVKLEAMRKAALVDLTLLLAKSIERIKAAKNAR